MTTGELFQTNRTSPVDTSGVLIRQEVHATPRTSTRTIVICSRRLNGAAAWLRALSRPRAETEVSRSTRDSAQRRERHRGNEGIELGLGRV